MDLKNTFLLASILIFILSCGLASARPSSRHRRNKSKDLDVKSNSTKISEEASFISGNGSHQPHNVFAGSKASEDAVTRSSSERKAKKSHRIKHKRKGHHKSNHHRRRKIFRRLNGTSSHDLKKDNASQLEVDQNKDTQQFLIDARSELQPNKHHSGRRNGKSKRHHRQSKNHHSREGRRKKFRVRQQSLSSELESKQ